MASKGKERGGEMGKEVNLLKLYPVSNRPVDERGALVTEIDRAIARKFDVEYFDKDRLTGYGGYSYNPKFWTETVAHIRDFYNLNNDSKILDVGCAKGFMMHDFSLLLPKAEIVGVDIDLEILKVAKQKAKALGLLPDNPQFVHSDMTKLKIERQDFSLITIPENAILMIFSYAERVNFLNQISKQLGSKGKILISVFVPNNDFLYDNSQDPISIGSVENPHNNNMYRLSAHNRFDHTQQLNHALQIVDEFTPHGELIKTTELEFDLAYMWPHQVVQMLEDADLEIENIWGGYNRSNFTDESDVMLTVSKIPSSYYDCK